MALTGHDLERQADNDSATTPSDADMIEAMFRALVCIMPGAALIAQRELFDQLRYRGAEDEDLAVISDWLIARGK